MVSCSLLHACDDGCSGRQGAALDNIVSNMMDATKKGKDVLLVEG